MILINHYPYYCCCYSLDYHDDLIDNLDWKKNELDRNERNFYYFLHHHHRLYRVFVGVVVVDDERLD